jgi:hypothetical protein
MSSPDLGPGRDASRAFASGFAGCLGVGLAILAVFVTLLILAGIFGHH